MWTLLLWTPTTLQVIWWLTCFFVSGQGWPDNHGFWFMMRLFWGFRSIATERSALLPADVVPCIICTAGLSTAILTSSDVSSRIVLPCSESRAGVCCTNLFSCIALSANRCCIWIIWVKSIDREERPSTQKAASNRTENNSTKFFHQVNWNGEGSLPSWTHCLRNRLRAHPPQERFMPLVHSLIILIPKFCMGFKDMELVNGLIQRYAHARHHLCTLISPNNPRLMPQLPLFWCMSLSFR